MLKKDDHHLFKRVMILFSLVFFVIVIVILIFKSEWIYTLALSIFGVLTGLVLSYYLFFTYSDDKPKFDLGPDDELIFELEKPIRIVMPKDEAGVITDGPPVESKIHFTKKAIIVEPTDVDSYSVGDDLLVLYIHYDSIIQYSVEKRLFASFIRFNYVSHNGAEINLQMFADKQHDILLGKLKEVVPERFVNLEF